MSAFPISPPSAASIAAARVRLRALEASSHRWLVAHSVAILRVSVGAVFLGFGLLKFFPGVAPPKGWSRRRRTS